MDRFLPIITCPTCKSNNHIVFEPPQFDEKFQIILLCWCHKCRTDFKTLHTLGRVEDKFDIRIDKDYPW